ncbi:SPOR domain-containing protein [Spirosoma luteum]|uniref:HU domain-containing protein n=1 Tax=Spirosoma luteum TaxID=431553 RepID=UPI00035CC9AC|nr:SPOR domain-containing protein [Spirosoma luteum]
MASVNNYLKKLLYQYDCIVVPELGAFLTHYQSAVYTETSGLYLPPRKRVAFNEALRFDDGILANYIMLHEPVTREGAQRLISSFVSDLRMQVETTGRFELEGIGTFTQNEESRLQFSPGLRQNFFGESYGMSAIPAQLVNQQVLPEPVLEAVPVSTLNAPTTGVGPVLIQEDDTVFTPYRPARTYWRVAAAALLIGSLGAVSYFSVIKPGQPFQSSLDPANLLRIPVSSFIASADSRKSPKSEAVQEATPLPVVENPITTPNLPVDTAAIAPVSSKPEEVAVGIAEPVAAPVAVKKAEFRVAKAKLRKRRVKPVVMRAYTGPHFTVIAGVFSSRRNALSLTRQLQKAGYTDAFIILPQRGQKGRYKVAAVGSATREELADKVSAIKELTGAEPWIMDN